MLRQRDTSNPLDEVRPVATAARVGELIRYARSVHISPAVEQYIVALAAATRSHPEIRLGASPRATLQLARAAKVWAALEGRAFVLPDDVAALLAPIFAHRVIPSRVSGSRGSDNTVPHLLEHIASSVRVPLASRQ